ncbi:LecA/PA-IL family lectin [Agromyces aurantiacus]|uniref:LecA/PA-IL family lectin n=1 Tax=Agromyces aurantiacus TaxID=165814 RepID=A0ABV9R2A8_9MICO|nr:LecA/PA-IL family lectin [Agromyces aurantiacus]MBM7505903.1 hypothetical protein [Agromyces aurantiacus]
MRPRLVRTAAVTAALAFGGAFAVGNTEAALAAPPPTSVFVDARIDGVGTRITLNAQRQVVITATGTAASNPFEPYYGPDGSSDEPQFDFLAPYETPYSLVARVGDGSWVAVGSGPTTVTGKGKLQLAFNDVVGDYADNVGGFTATIEITSAR